MNSSIGFFINLQENSGNHVRNRALSVFKLSDVIICLLMAQHCIITKNTEYALECIQECMRYNPNDVKILTSVLRLHMYFNSSIDLYRDVCLQILHIDSDNVTSTVMMADLSFRQMDLENSANHFSQLLLAHPCNWMALTRFVEVMRRLGTLSNTLPFLERAEHASQNPRQSPGLNYCRGLYYWYNANRNTSLRSFNAARKDCEWGPQAIRNMIEICLNPDKNIPNESNSEETETHGEFGEARAAALRTADQLLKELRSRQNDIYNDNWTLLENFLKIASKEKFQIESALQDFTDLLINEDPEKKVGAVLGVATALLALKQTQKAKTHLKRLVRVTLNFENAEYLERSWLLLADIYVNSCEWDVAESLVQKVIQHNKSCTKAFELAGLISEKNELYAEASTYYNNAWVSSGKSNPYIAFKLAYNLMNSKNFSGALIICQQALNLHPDFTPMRKEIFDKCRNNLRI